MFGTYRPKPSQTSRRVATEMNAWGTAWRRSPAPVRLVVLGLTIRVLDLVHVVELPKLIHLLARHLA